MQVAMPLTMTPELSSEFSKSATMAVLDNGALCELKPPGRLVQDAPAQVGISTRRQARAEKSYLLQRLTSDSQVGGLSVGTVLVSQRVSLREDPRALGVPLRQGSARQRHDLAGYQADSGISKGLNERLQPARLGSAINIGKGKDVAAGSANPGVPGGVRALNPAFGQVKQPCALGCSFLSGLPEDFRGTIVTPIINQQVLDLIRWVGLSAKTAYEIRQFLLAIIDWDDDGNPYQEGLMCAVAAVHVVIEMPDREIVPGMEWSIKPLGFPVFVEPALLLKKFAEGTLFDKLAILDHDDLIGVPYRRKPVGNDN